MSFDFLKPSAPVAHVIDYSAKKPARESHDAEIAWRNAWVRDPRATSYFWSAERDGKTFLQEYDACACGPSANDVHPKAHLHTLAELPGIPKVVSVATVQLCDVCGAMAPVEGIFPPSDSHAHAPQERAITIPTFAFTEPFSAFTFRATPVNAEGQSLPDDVTFVCDPATTHAIIWGHRAFREDGGLSERVNPSTGAVEQLHNADSLLVGRILLDGTQEVHQIYPNGERFVHASLDEANAHLHPALHGSLALAK